jgi:poly(3-hydroxybutyrate) depolymerase
MKLHNAGVPARPWARRPRNYVALLALIAGCATVVLVVVAKAQRIEPPPASPQGPTAPADSRRNASPANSAQPAVPQAEAEAVPPQNTGSGPHSLDVTGTKRDYVLHLPAGYDSAKRYPVLIAFHGIYQNAAQFEQASELDGIADKHGMIVAYPETTGDDWNLGFPSAMPQRYGRRRRGWGYPPQGPFPGGPPPVGYPGGYPPSGLRWTRSPAPQADEQEGGERREGGAAPDDLAFFDALVAYLQHQYSTEPARVYLTGMNEGGMMAFRVACARSQNVAAVGVVGAAIPRAMNKGCTLTRPVPLLMINGERDPVVPYTGGRSRVGLSTLAVEDSAKLWAKMDNCLRPVHSNQAPAVAGAKSVHVTAWRTCAQSSAVQLDSLPGSGGAWPGSSAYQPEIRFGKASQSLNAGETIWLFESGFRPAGR